MHFITKSTNIHFYSRIIAYIDNYAELKLSYWHFQMWRHSEFSHVFK